MKVTHKHIDGNRYTYDWGQCSRQAGFAQIDTKEDASYYGNWANPIDLKTVHYVEGDVSEYEFETREEFVQHIRDLIDGMDRLGYGPVRIDGMCDPRIIEGFKDLGLGDLLH